MKCMSLPNLLALAGMALIGSQSTPVCAQIFTDNFESGNLNRWSSDAHGVIAVDPLNSSNHALHFTARQGGGDLFSPSMSLLANTTYRFQFDYLGMTSDANGFAALDNPEYWIFGVYNYSVPINMVDDGTWHHYSIDFTPTTNQQRNLKFEDYNGGSSTGNAWFDNISLAPAVPEPGNVAVLCGAGFTALYAGLRRRNRR